MTERELLLSKFETVCQRFKPLVAEAQFLLGELYKLKKMKDSEVAK